MPCEGWRWGRSPRVKGIESGVSYSAFFFDPRNGREYPIGRVEGDEKGEWRVPAPPVLMDWVLVMERVQG